MNRINYDMTRKYSEEQSIASIQKAYGIALGDSEIRYINQGPQDLLVRHQHGEITSQFVAEKLIEVFRPTTLKDLDTDRLYNRSYINSKMASVIAENLYEVRQFREKFLKGKLVPSDSIEKWVIKTAKKDGKPSRWVTGIPFPIKFDQETAAEGTQIKQDRGEGYVRGLELTYLVTKNSPPKGVYVTAEGVLDSLRVLSNRLSLAIGWSEYECSTFVLTGIYPQVRAIESGIQIFSHNRFENKITLKIDPTCNAKEVLNHFNWVKRNYFENPKTREATSKSELLALHYVLNIHGKLDRISNMETWNSFCRGQWGQPDWIYERKDISNFQRDLRTAYDRYEASREIKKDMQATIKPSLEQGKISTIRK
mgnify:CR=1 FL=1